MFSEKKPSFSDINKYLVQLNKQIHRIIIINFIHLLFQIIFFIENNQILANSLANVIKEIPDVEFEMIY